MFDIRRGEQVRVKTDIVRGGFFLLKAGTEGKVITMRKEDNGRPGYLVKWKKYGMVAVVRSDIERVL